MDPFIVAEANYNVLKGLWVPTSGSSVPEGNIAADDELQVHHAHITIMNYVI